MKTPAIFRTFAALAAATTLANLTGSATAQVPTPEKPPTVTAAPVDRDAKLPMVDFREARISDVVEFLDKKMGGLNVIVQPKVQNLTVTLKLRNVTAAQVLEAIPFATENRVQIIQLQDEITGIEASPGPDLVGEDGRPLNRVQCRIFSLMTYLGGKDPKAQEEAIAQIERTLNTAVAMLRQSDPASNVQIPKMEVNGSAKLLIAVGMPDDLAVVEQLVTALQGSAVPVPAPAGRGAGFGPAGGRAPSRPGTPGLPGVPGATPGSPGAPVPPPANPNAPGALLPGLEIPAQAQAQ